MGPSVVSLFSGCGGLDLGFKQAGFPIRFASDHDPAAVDVYRRNVGNEVRLLDVTADEYPSVIAELGSCDVLLGGFPCQGFSKAGPKRRSDDRNQLYLAMITAMRSLRPAVFVAENVDGLAQNYNGDMLRQIIADCAAVGYEVEWKIVDAAWFGVPQHRRRIVIVGIRDDIASAGVRFAWPAGSHRPLSRNGERSTHQDYPAWNSSLLAPRTIRDALSGLPHTDNETPEHKAKDLAVIAAIREGQKLCNARHDQTSVRTWDVPEAFGTTTEREREILETIVRNRRHKRYGSIPNGNPLALDVLRGLFSEDLTASELDALVARKFLKRVGERWDVAGAMFASGLYKRPMMDAPSPTVLTVFASPRFFVHPSESRGFTVREVARLQTFPDDFEFSSARVSATDAYRLIGNAVPPILGQQIATQVFDIFVQLAKEAAA